MKKRPNKSSKRVRRPKKPAGLKIPRQRISPEILEWAKKNVSKKEILAGLKEIRKTGGLELKDFIHELEEAANLR